MHRVYFGRLYGGIVSDQADGFAWEISKHAVVSWEKIFGIEWQASDYRGSN